MNHPIHPDAGATGPASERSVTKASRSDLPSGQSPDGAAQVGMSPADAQRVGQPDYVGGSAMAGLAAGAAVGAVVGGPIGALVGGTVGTAAGILGGEAAETADTPKLEKGDDGMGTPASGHGVPKVTGKPKLDKS